jgi:hypothetical protein
VVALVILGVPPIAGFFLLRSFRDPVRLNSAAAIGATRTLISAQTAYAEANHGYFDSVDCLRAPARCIPGYAPERPELLGSAFAQTTRHGYAFRLHLGPAPADLDRAVASPSSVTTYAYVAIPEPGQGPRAFCGDSTGALFSWADGKVPAVEGGVCPRGGAPVL